MFFFFPRTVMVLVFLSSVSVCKQFWFIFIYGMRKCLRFIFLCVVVQFPWYHVLERHSSTYCIFLSLLKWLYVHGFTSVLHFVPRFMCRFLYQYHTVLNYVVCRMLWSQRAWCCQICPLFKIALATQGLLGFYTHFRIICSSSVKYAMGIFLEFRGILLNL